MIRRSREDQFLLIAQNDHALLAGELSEQFGNAAFSRPEPFEQAVRGVRLHDCGWPLHDDEPTINADGLPLDVFETPREIGLRVWTASADRAQQQDAYAGLLVSLHVLSLSVLASNPPPELDRVKWNMDNPAEQFAVIKFQQREIERQERLRLIVGLRTEKQTLHRVPVEAQQKREDGLTFNLRMLQAMDVISLAACCTTPPTARTQELLAHPGGSRLRLKLERRGDDVLVDPWPFAVGMIELKIPCRVVSAMKYQHDAALQTALKAAPGETIISRIVPS
jgi:hypothetical protein